jgi:hypothetical protein
MLAFDVADDIEVHVRLYGVMGVCVGLVVGDHGVLAPWGVHMVHGAGRGLRVWACVVSEMEG